MENMIICNQKCFVPTQEQQLSAVKSSSWLLRSVVMPSALAGPHFAHQLCGMFVHMKAAGVTPAELWAPP